MNAGLTLRLERERYVPGETLSARVEGDLSAVSEPLSLVAYYCETTGSEFATPASVLGESAEQLTPDREQGLRLTLTLPGDAPPSFQWPEGQLSWFLTLSSRERHLAGTEAMFEVDPSPHAPLAREHAWGKPVQRGPTARAGLGAQRSKKPRSYGRPGGDHAPYKVKYSRDCRVRRLLFATAVVVIELACLGAMIPFLREEISVLWGLVPAIVLLLTAAAGVQSRMLAVVALLAPIVTSTMVALALVPESRGEVALAAAGFTGLLLLELLARGSPTARAATGYALVSVVAGGLVYLSYVVSREAAREPTTFLIVVALFGGCAACGVLGRLLAGPIHRWFPESDHEVLRGVLPFMFPLWVVPVGVVLFVVFEAG